MKHSDNGLIIAGTKEILPKNNTKVDTKMQNIFTVTWDAFYEKGKVGCLNIPDFKI